MVWCSQLPHQVQGRVQAHRGLVDRAWAIPAPGQVQGPDNVGRQGRPRINGIEELAPSLSEVLCVSFPPPMAYYHRTQL